MQGKNTLLVTYIPKTLPFFLESSFHRIVKYRFEKKKNDKILDILMLEGFNVSEEIDKLRERGNGSNLSGKKMDFNIIERKRLFL